MTVAEKHPTTGDIKYIWFEGSKRMEDWFPPGTLKKWEEPDWSSSDDYDPFRSGGRSKITGY
jgi:hypothetical protein